MNCIIKNDDWNESKKKCLFFLSRLSKTTSKMSRCEINMKQCKILFLIQDLRSQLQFRSRSADVLYKRLSGKQNLRNCTKILYSKHVTQTKPLILPKLDVLNLKYFYVFNLFVGVFFCITVKTTCIRLTTSNNLSNKHTFCKSQFFEFAVREKL